MVREDALCSQATTTVLRDILAPDASTTRCRPSRHDPRPPRPALDAGARCIRCGLRLGRRVGREPRGVARRRAGGGPVGRHGRRGAAAPVAGRHADHRVLVHQGAGGARVPDAERPRAAGLRRSGGALLAGLRDARERAHHGAHAAEPPRWPARARRPRDVGRHRAAPGAGDRAAGAPVAALDAGPGSGLPRGHLRALRRRAVPPHRGRVHWHLPATRGHEAPGRRRLPGPAGGVRDARRHQLPRDHARAAAAHHPEGSRFAGHRGARLPQRHERGRCRPRLRLPTRAGPGRHPQLQHPPSARHGAAVGQRHRERTRPVPGVRGAGQRRRAGRRAAGARRDHRAGDAPAGLVRARPRPEQAHRLEPGLPEGGHRRVLTQHRELRSLVARAARWPGPTLSRASPSATP
jgi:hypothetical protein